LTELKVILERLKILAISDGIMWETGGSAMTSHHCCSRQHRQGRHWIIISMNLSHSTCKYELNGVQIVCICEGRQEAAGTITAVPNKWWWAGQDGQETRQAS